MNGCRSSAEASVAVADQRVKITVQVAHGDGGGGSCAAWLVGLLGTWLGGHFGCLGHLGQTSVTAFVYVLRNPPPELAALPCLGEYTLPTHLALYKPIEHIQLKQQLYLGGTARYGGKATARHPQIRMETAGAS